MNSILKLIIVYICYTKIETEVLLTKLPNKQQEDLRKKDSFEYQHKLLEKKIKLDHKYKVKKNTNENLNLYLDIEGKWVGYKNYNYSTNRKNELGMVIKDNQRMINTTLFGSVKLLN